MTEPLPQDDPLWAEPRVLITPHASWGSDDYAARLADLAAENIRAIEEGTPLRNEVDRAVGYLRS